MMIVPANVSPNRHRALNKYSKAKKRYLKALYKDDSAEVWLQIVELLPSARFEFEYGETKWVRPEEYKVLKKLTKSQWSISNIITEKEMAHVWFAGWARKVGYVNTTF